MYKLINLIFPETCMFCGDKSSVICTKCLIDCRTLTYDYCLVCDKFSSLGITHKLCRSADTPVNVISCFSYDGRVRTCIKRSKYGAKAFRGLKVLSKVGAEFLSSYSINYRDYYIVPIPLSRQKARTRGFNQAELVAKEVSAKLNLTLLNNALIRSSNSQAQFSKNRSERFTNVSGIFEATQKVNDKKILLVDDICTTGATLLEATRVLNEAGASIVSCFTLAKKT